MILENPKRTDSYAHVVAWIRELEADVDRRMHRQLSIEDLADLVRRKHHGLSFAGAVRLINQAREGRA